MFLPSLSRCRSFTLGLVSFASVATHGAEKIDVSKIPPAATRVVDFAKDVQPIFEQHCLKCHGPEKQKGGWRVDVKAVALTKGDNYAPNIVPGKSAESPLIHFVAGLDPDMKMPSKGDPLTAEQIGLLRAWIDQGAVWPEVANVAKSDPLDWWSLQPLRRPAVPLTGSGDIPVAENVGDRNVAPPSNPIDAFIHAKLAEKSLAPSLEADARTLCRRVYFDLIGLPPTPEEIEAFVREMHESNGSHVTYERLVDRLLASPQYGERWARHWLDVVRYGETHGYDKDKPRNNAWPYRDYVIRAFNEDKPYARFVQEQIAGDVLFPHTRDGLEALGFIAAGPWDLIGHMEVPESKTDGKIARHLDRDDMVSNTMGTFASATVHCAQCHNHKFDPFSQEDYYSLQAVFAALDRTDRKYFRDEKLNARFDELQSRQREVANAITALEAPLKRQAGEPFTALSRRIEGASKQAAQKQGNATPDFGYHSAISPVQDAIKWVQVDLGQRVNIERVTLLPCYDDFNAIGAGFGFPVRFKVEASDDPEFKTGVALFWRQHDLTFMADFKNPGLQPFTTNGAKDDGLAGRYVRVTAVKLAPRKNDFIFALAELQVVDVDGKNVAQGRPVAALDSIEAPPRWRQANLTDGIAPVAPSPDEKDALIKEREALLLSFADEATKAKRATLLDDARQLEAELQKLPPPNAVYSGAIHTGTGSFRGTGADGGKPRPIFLLARGQVTRPEREVGPGALAALTFQPARFTLPADAPEGERRAALARWLTDSQNPLTWRSIVNRVWQYHFGRGLVETPNDFGHMGQQPTHPELLDWLAAEFRDGGGSLKRLHKIIVTSETWRQSSGSGAFQAPSAAESRRSNEADSDNRYLWRMNRRKLEAEAIRDSVLAAAGKLDLTMGGPSFQDFVIEQPAHSPHYEYRLHNPDDPKSHRRSIYRFIVRSQPQPFLTTLDCADPSMSVEKRNESMSALQALALLNNQLMVVMAKHFAERVQAEAPGVEAQIERAFRLALGRAPTGDERQSLSAYAQEFGLPNACRVILNLNEFVFVD
jgi:mono/diheme cytochrome c family protein